MDSREIAVRQAEPADEQAWRRLFAAYLKFYRTEISDAATSETWRRVHDASSGVHCLVASRDGAVSGFANYLFHPSTWDPRPTCYLQDLFVDEAVRGSGAARRLILACEAAAKARGAFRLYWVTQEFNAPARSLYDTLAQRTSFIVYRMPLA